MTGEANGAGLETDAERRGVGTQDAEPGDAPLPDAAPADGAAAIDDEELVRRASRGDHRSFRALVDRHAARLYAVAASLVGSDADAEDVVQEAFVGAYRGLGKFEGRASVKTWLIRIVFRQAARWRRSRPRAAESIDAMTEEDRDAGRRLQLRPATSDVDRRTDVAALLKRLAPDHREVIVLREMQGLTYEEIASVLGVPRGTVESRLHRARAELKVILKDYIR